MKNKIKRLLLDPSEKYEITQPKNINIPDKTEILIGSSPRIFFGIISILAFIASLICFANIIEPMLNKELSIYDMLISIFVMVSVLTIGTFLLFGINFLTKYKFDKEHDIYSNNEVQ
jgi:hypothetical protein